MALAFKVDSLDKVPESAREMYEQDGDGYRLSVEGVKTEDDVAELAAALKKERAARKALESKAGKISDDDLEELDRLRAEARERDEKKAKEEGKWDELRAKLQAEHDKKLAALTKQLDERSAEVERLVVKNELRSAIAQAGVKPEYHRAVELMLLEEGRPKVQREDGKDPFGVFPDELHGDKRITDYVKDWAKTDAASSFMPPVNGAGGGAGGAGGGGKRPSYEGKKFSEMSVEEQIAYTDAKYGEGAAA